MRSAMKPSYNVGEITTVGYSNFFKSASLPFSSSAQANWETKRFLSRLSLLIVEIAFSRCVCRVLVPPEIRQYYSYVRLNRRLGGAFLLISYVSQETFDASLRGVGNFVLSRIARLSSIRFLFFYRRFLRFEYYAVNETIFCRVFLRHRRRVVHRAATFIYDLFRAYVPQEMRKFNIHTMRAFKFLRERDITRQSHKFRERRRQSLPRRVFRPLECFLRSIKRLGGSRKRRFLFVSR